MRGDGVRVLVVGAGIAGLAAARTLRGWGAAVEVVERATAPTTEGTGIYLPGNAVRALDSLGLSAQVAERAVRIDRQRVADHRGRLLFEVETAELWDGYAEPVPTLLDALDEAGTGAGHAGAIEEVVLKSWSHGHVLLIGDAAHATSPNMAQGAAMALEDALVLAGSLNSCHSCRRLFRLACSDPTGAARPGTFVRQLLYTCQTQ